MYRRWATVVLGLVGAAATVATSPAPPPPPTARTSAPSSIAITLRPDQPTLAFTVTASGTGAVPAFATLRAEVRVDDDGDPATDGLPIVDVGLLPLPDDGSEPSLPEDVDAVDDPALASVFEGTFAVSRDIDPFALADGVELVLAARLRPERAVARVTFVVVLEGAVAADDAGADAEPALVVDVALRPDAPDDAAAPPP